MSRTQVELTGTLRPDGTLALDERPDLPPGRVRVIVQAVPEAAPKEDWWEFMQRARRELEAGHDHASVVSVSASGPRGVAIETVVTPSIARSCSAGTLSGPGPAPWPTAGCGYAVERAV